MNNLKSHVWSFFLKAIMIASFVVVSIRLQAQKNPTWDNTEKSNWSTEFEEVDILSSADSSRQKAYLYRSKSDTPKPLIVSLHTWSGDYTQKDPLVKEILARDWNYIHPDFRGANNKPEAMGSPLVISDIEDAIQYAIANTNSHPEEVHIVGVSGGGYATFLAYMNIQYPVKSFSAWAPISDIEAWYWESIGRKQKYATDMWKATSSDTVFNKKEALRRSPVVQSFPKERRENAKLFIYEGVHDGYTGSVPITHSINMYNRLAGELKYGTSDMDRIAAEAGTDSVLVSQKEIIDLLSKRTNPDNNKQQTLFGRSIYLSREYKNIRLTIFEGGHEQIPQALALLPCNNTTSLKYNILTIGDSNAQNKDGWVDQLKKMMPDSRIVNISRSGRTIGFDNNGHKDLNALRNIDAFLDEAQSQIGNQTYDYIMICLGTNDTKNEFSEQQDEVVANFEKLLDKIKSHPLSKKSKAKCIYITPPPVKTKDIAPKYEGCNERLALLIPQFETIATRKKFDVINVYQPLTGIFDDYAPDGVHMLGAGQEIIALQIIEAIQN